jgi:uncharacterized membrane protein (UPF0136 family)
MSPNTVLWVYIVLLELGGIMGFVKAKSKVSIIASTISAGILVLFALNILPFIQHVWVVGLLFIMFVMRYVKTKKPMPNVVMAVLSLVELILVHLLPHGHA